MSQAILKDPEYTAVLEARYADATRDEIAGWAKAWGVSKDSIRHRAHALNLRRSAMAKSNAKAESAHQRNGTVPPYEMPEPNRDEEYVAACLAEGGFGRYLETRGARGVVRLTGPYVPYTAERNARRSQVAA